MQTVALIFSGISAAAAIASAIAAFIAKGKVKALTEQINNIQMQTVQGDIQIKNDHKNTGTIMGINTGALNDR